MEYKPTIVAFLCNWCSYTGADLAGTSQDEICSEYPRNKGNVFRQGRTHFRFESI